MASEELANAGGWGPYLRQAGLLVGVGVLGYLALVPYLLSLVGDQMAAQAEAAGLSVSALLVVGGVQSAVLMTFMTTTGLAAADRLGLEAPVSAVLAGRSTRSLAAWWRAAAGPAIVLGAVLGAGVVGLDLAVFMTETPEPEAASSPSWWRGLLASLYGSVSEELLLRLGLLSWLALGLRRLLARDATGLPDLPFWIANVLAALLFGAGHLPAAAALGPLTVGSVFRVLLLNGVLALAFGWLYRRHGLEAAMVSHGVADLVLHVLTPLALGS